MNSTMSEFKYLKYLSIISHYDAQTENNSYKAILMINNRNSNKDEYCNFFYRLEKKNEKNTYKLEVDF